MVYFSRHKVKRFRNCPNPGCSAHYQPARYEMAPEYVKQRAEGKPIMVCGHCGIVWYEEPSIDSRRYHIFRNAAGNWLENPWIEIYSLQKHRKRNRRKL